MFLFRLPNGKCILHTGDFRANQLMEEYPEFWNNAIDLIYLDTTYLSDKYDFLPQDDAVYLCVEECRRFFEKKSSIVMKRCLIVCGTYVIGKEKVWLSIAQEFNLKVYLDKQRRNAMNCLADSSILSVLESDPYKANIHVYPLGNIQYKMMADYLRQFADHFDTLLAIRPSGWEKSRSSRPTFNGRVSILNIAYSEHSSYSELERFVRFLQPERVISTVPSHKDMDKVPDVPNDWLTNELKVKRDGAQMKMKEFLKVIFWKFE